MNFQNKLLASICLLLLGLNGFGKDNTLPQFWKRVEVGTNIIPLIDSTSLNFDNLMLKYYYNTEQSRAFRINLFLNDLYIGTGSPENYVSKYHFELGHVWYYNLNQKINFLYALDFSYKNNTNRWYNILFSGTNTTNNPEGTTPQTRDAIYHYNEYTLKNSAGLKFQIFKNLNIEFESSLLLGFDEYFTNYQDINNTHYYVNSRNYYLRCKIKPLSTLTLNYKF